jgi:DNA polymerase-3 subunit delta'
MSDVGQASADAYMPALPWHAAAWDRLRPLLSRGTHAILLHGAAGIGKKSLAIDIARAALCEAPTAEHRACGRCAGCLLAAAGNHPDLRIVVPDTMAGWRGVAAEDDDAEHLAGSEQAEVDAAAEEGGKRTKLSSQIRIPQVRALADFIATSTHRGGRRVVLIAPAERLNTEAANSLLKMLEEPPPASLFLLVTDAIDDLLPTVRSRCVLVRVSGPARADALAWLAALQVDRADERLAAAGGAPVGALALAQGDEQDAASRDLLLDLLGRGARLTPELIAESIPKTIAVAGSLTVMQRWCWDLLACATLHASRAVRYFPARAAVVAQVAQDLEVTAIHQWNARLTRHRAAQHHPLNARLAVEAALLDYASCFKPKVTGRSLHR